MNIVTSDEAFYSGRVLVLFGSKSCTPCRMTTTYIDQLSPMYGDVDFYKVDVDEGSSIAQKFHVRSLPTILTFNNGEIVRTTIGGVTKSALVNIIEEIANA